MDFAFLKNILEDLVVRLVNMKHASASSPLLSPLLTVTCLGMVNIIVLCDSHSQMILISFIATPCKNGKACRKLGMRQLSKNQILILPTSLFL